MVLGSSTRRRPVSGGRSRTALAAAALLASTLVACGGGGEGGTPTLTWYINPDNGGQQDLASKCTKAAGGDYRIDVGAAPQRCRRPAGAARPSAGGRRQLDRPHEPRPGVRARVRQRRLPPALQRRRGRSGDEGRARRSQRDGQVERQGGGGPVLGQHPAPLVPQVGRRAGRYRSCQRAGHVGPGHQSRRADQHHGRGHRRPLRGLHGVDQRPGPLGRWRGAEGSRGRQGRDPRARHRCRAGGGRDHPPRGHQGRRPGHLHRHRGECRVWGSRPTTAGS